MSPAERAIIVMMKVRRNFHHGAFMTAPAPAETTAVDPRAVPFFSLKSGARLPAIGMGTFGSDHITADEIAEAVLAAGRMGWRHFDCASVYTNEKEVGGALTRLQSEGVARGDLWVTGKLWNDRHGAGPARASFEKSLRDLNLDFLNLYLIHWPFPNFHAPGCDVTSRSPDSKPYIHESYMETWRALERLVDEGLVKHIGTSNMTVPKMKLLLRDARIRPAVNEMELHPHFQQSELFDFCVQNGIQPIGYSPIGSPNRPLRDRTPDDTVDLEDPVLLGIAEERGEHPVATTLRWHIQRGDVPIPFSTKPKNLLSNLKAALTAPLTTAQMQSLAKIDRNCRLIKGHVFLWKENQTWEDLWDMDGTIPS